MSTKENQKLVLYEETHTESALTQYVQTQRCDRSTTDSIFT